jgi:uncharacterized protein (DUF2249 family)
MSWNDVGYEPEGRTIEVDTVHPYDLFSTIITFTGTDLNTGERVTFGVDHRPARDIRWALEAEYAEHPTVYDVQEWAVLKVEAAA